MFLATLDKAYDLTPTPPPFLEDGETVLKNAGQMETNSRGLAQATWEILPYFASEGIREFPVVPRAVTLVAFSDFDGLNLAGATTCATGRVVINYRFADPWAPEMYGHPMALGVLAHELAHLQGICGWEDDTEPAAELVSAEILAAMVENGNRYALKPLLRIVRAWAMGALRAQMDAEGWPAWMYRGFMQNIVFDPSEAAQYDWNERLCASYGADCMRFVRLYQQRPWDLWMQAWAGNNWTAPLPLHGRNALHMDDLRYVIEHLPDLVIASWRGC